jgi:antitoxin component YwqK of YwqJK toxin-antitoxin module
MGARCGVGWIAVLCGALACATPAETYYPSVACRDGAPDGPFELRDARGTLVVSGSLAGGVRDGTFHFHDGGGLRQVELRYRQGTLDGPVRLWWSRSTTRTGDPRPKLEARYVDGVPDGGARSWHPDGRRRGEFEYDRGRLIAARLWNPDGAAASDAEAAECARLDLEADGRYYAVLADLVDEHIPACSAFGRSGPR